MPPIPPSEYYGVNWQNSNRVRDLIEFASSEAKSVESADPQVLPNLKEIVDIMKSVTTFTNRYELFHRQAEIRLKERSLEEQQKVKKEQDKKYEEAKQARIRATYHELMFKGQQKTENELRNSEARC